MMQAILVGNSTALLDGDCGELIDAHDLVVRFNGGDPLPHPQALGMRTDYWSFSTLHASQYHQWRIRGAIPMCLNRRITYPLRVPGAVYSDDETYAALIKSYGHPRPSTGLITAHYICRRWACRVSCIGFDFFTNGTWYRGSNEHIPHDGAREREYMQGLGVTVL